MNRETTRRLEASIKKIVKYLDEMDKYPGKNGLYRTQIYNQLEIIGYFLRNNDLQNNKIS